MRTRPRRVGAPGAAVLAATGLAGALLAAHGWAGWHVPAVPGAIGPAAAASQSAHGAVTGPSGAASATASASTGPLLGSQPFAPYAYQVWPGQRSPAAQTALAGLTVAVHRQGAGLSVVAGVNGQQGSPRYYPLGARVYVVEAALGDDSGNSDYNLGDDGIVVTDGRGRIVS